MSPGDRYGREPGRGPLPKRSIYAQIDEINAQLERARRETRHVRGHDESEAREHVLRLECVLRTLHWVRDHQDDIRAIAASRTAGRKGPSS